MGMPIVGPPKADDSGLLDSGPIEPPAPRRSTPTLPPPIPTRLEPAQGVARAAPRPTSPPPLGSGWATGPTAQPMPQPAFARALERDRMMARILWGTVLAIAIGVGIVLAYVM